MQRDIGVAGTGCVVVPVDAEEIERVGLVRADARERGLDRAGDQARLGELRKGRQRNLR